MILDMYVCVCVLHYQKTSGGSQMPDDPCKDAKYKESTIDSMRAQKDEVQVTVLFLAHNF